MIFVFIKQFPPAVGGGPLLRMEGLQSPRRSWGFTAGSFWVACPEMGDTEGTWEVLGVALVTIHVFRNIQFMKSTYERSNPHF